MTKTMSKLLPLYQEKSRFTLEYEIFSYFLLILVHREKTTEMKEFLLIFTYKSHFTVYEIRDVFQ